MKPLLKIASYLGLSLSIIPAFALFAGALSRETYLLCMTVGMALWFGTSPFWIKAPKPGE